MAVRHQQHDPMTAPAGAQQGGHLKFFGVVYDAGTQLRVREYYDLKSDPWELQNVLADNDPKNDPDVAGLSARLQRAEHCAGRAGLNPCP